MRGSVAEIFLVFLRLGCTSFGGPVAHLGYFRSEFVMRRRWLTEATFADLVGLCQFMPGPASSQVGMGIGLLRGGPRGMLAAWVGFTLPSALAMALFAFGIGLVGGDMSHAGWLRGHRSWSPSRWWCRRFGGWRAPCRRTGCVRP